MQDQLRSDPPPTKKPCMEVLHSVPFLVILPAPKPSDAAVGPSRVPDVGPYTGKDARPELGGSSTGSAQFSNDSVECVALVPPRPQAPRAPSRDEMVELLKQVPYFTESETPVSNMEEFFPATEQVSVYLDGDPRISFMTRLLVSTPESVFSRIWPMRDYTVVEMAEVVSLSHLQFMVP